MHHEYEFLTSKINCYCKGGGDDWVLTLEQMQELYADIPSEKAMARRVNTGHGETLYSEDGYVVAWFMWKLQGDEEAAKAFTGADAELLQNELYQDQKIHKIGVNISSKSRTVDEWVVG